MLPKFYKITSLEKKKKIIRVFSKQHGFTSQDCLVVRSNGWGFFRVVGTSPASKGVGCVTKASAGKTWSAERERDEAKEEVHLARLAVVEVGDVKALEEDKLARVQDSLVATNEAR